MNECDHESKRVCVNMYVDERGRERAVSPPRVCVPRCVLPPRPRSAPAAPHTPHTAGWWMDGDGWMSRRGMCGWRWGWMDEQTGDVWMEMEMDG